MKVGDLVKIKRLDSQVVTCGVIIKLSRTGHTTHSAQVLWTDGEVGWFDTRVLETVNESW